MKKIIIIGAGMAGLSAGCYGQMNGYETCIFEAGSNPGGLCTSWERDGYLFESCIYWLFGTHEKNSLYRLWHELGVASPDRFIAQEEFIRLQWPDGRIFRVFSDLNRLADEMKRFAPEDVNLIDKIRTEAEGMASFNVYMGKPREHFTPLDFLKLLRSIGPNLSTILKYKNMPVETFAKRFKSQDMKDVIGGLMGFLPSYPALYLLLIFGHMHIGNASFPKGGSRGLARSVENQYRQLGGEIRYQSPVDRILTHSGKAVGVVLKDGQEFFSDIVISAADGHTTLFKMLEGKYLFSRIKRHYKELPVFHSYMQVSFGIDRDLSAEPAFLVRILLEPMVLGNTVVRDVRIRHYCFDETFAPKGKSSVVVTFACNYKYWDALSTQPEQYAIEKAKVKARVMAEVMAQFQLKEEYIEVTDVATPKTFERFTGNRQGSAEGWYVNHKTIDTVLDRRLPDLQNFYMAGHWVEISGGLPFAALSGRDAIHNICIEDRKTFKTDSMPIIDHTSKKTILQK